MPTRQPIEPGSTRLDVFYDLVTNWADGRELLDGKGHNQGQSFWRGLRFLPHGVTFLSGMFYLISRVSGKHIVSQRGEVMKCLPFSRSVGLAEAYPAQAYLMRYLCISVDVPECSRYFSLLFWSQINQTIAVPCTARSSSSRLRWSVPASRFWVL